MNRRFVLVRPRNLASWQSGTGMPKNQTRYLVSFGYWMLLKTSLWKTSRSHEYTLNVQAFCHPRGVQCVAMLFLRNWFPPFLTSSRLPRLSLEPSESFSRAWPTSTLPSEERLVGCPFFCWVLCLLLSFTPGTTQASTYRQV